jgi:putative ABC transport system permease protein
VETRVTPAVNLEVPGFADPVCRGCIVSLPEGRQPVLNRLFLREGRLVRAGARGRGAAERAFADAHGLRPGDGSAPSSAGAGATLTVVGIALSPEFLMQMQPGSLFPDPERFGVLWMGAPRWRRRTTWRAPSTTSPSPSRRARASRT